MRSESLKGLLRKIQSKLDHSTARNTRRAEPHAVHFSEDQWRSSIEPLPQGLPNQTLTAGFVMEDQPAPYLHAGRCGNANLAKTQSDLTAACNEAQRNSADVNASQNARVGRAGEGSTNARIKMALQQQPAKQSASWGRFSLVRLLIWCVHNSI